MPTSDEIQAIAKVLKRLYPQNPDIVLGREAREIHAALVHANALPSEDAENELVRRFRTRVADWRTMPIVGHGLYARYQDAQALLDDALDLLGQP